MRYTYKKKTKILSIKRSLLSNKFQIFIQTSQIYENIPRFLLYFRKSTISQTKDFLNNISRIYRAQYSINRARRSIARWKYSKCLSWETKVLSNYLCESYHACSENTFSAHSRESWLSNLGLRLGPPKTSDRSQLLSGLKISEMIANLFFHQISLGLPSATQNANYFLLRFFFRLMSSIQLLSSLF